MNYESNSSNYDNTWADQQAVIALRQQPAIVSCLLIVLCADSWHFSGVLIMRTVSRQLQKTTRYECAALTSVIDFIAYHAPIFPYNSPPSLISLLLNFQHPIYTTLTFSFQSLKLFFPRNYPFLLPCILFSFPVSFHFFYFTVILHSFLLFLSSLYPNFTFSFSYFIFSSPEFLCPLQFTVLMV